jgi:NADPH:quinone reductase-like Zn-dependent oxidoreductase
MKAARILRFGPPSVITEDDLPQPKPAPEQLLVRVKAAGAGNWDAVIRKGRVQLQPLPLTLGSELAGIVEGIGADVFGIRAWRRGIQGNKRAIQRGICRICSAFRISGDRHCGLHSIRLFEQEQE